MLQSDHYIKLLDTFCSFTTFSVMIFFFSFLILKKIVLISQNQRGGKCHLAKKKSLKTSPRAFSWLCEKQHFFVMNISMIRLKAL